MVRLTSRAWAAAELGLPVALLAVFTTGYGVGKPWRELGCSPAVRRGRYCLNMRTVRSSEIVAAPVEVLIFLL